MRAAADTIWAIPAYLPYLQPPLTDQTVAWAEKEIGYSLPGEYLDLLRKQNGGYIRFTLPETEIHESIAGIGPNFPSITFAGWDECQEYVSYPLKGLVPFDGDGHWHLCLDYRKNPASPCITYADVECDHQSHIADSFADYLGMLEFREDGERVLEAVSDIVKLKDDLSRRLGVSFDPTENWEQGYPMERARLSTAGHWLWISPNTVPRGFVRPDDARYSALKDILPGYGDRFPGLPASSYILQTNPKSAMNRVLEVCSEGGLTARPLSEYLAGI